MSNNVLSSDDVYEYSAIRNVTVIFGSVFSNLKVRKYNSDGTINKNESTLVPVAYAAKEQYGYWIEQQMRLPTGNIEINTKLPRISFEMTGLNVSPDRGTNTNLPIISKSIMKDGMQYRARGPISYNFDFSLSIWAKQMDDSIQILEQILPIFTPEISIKVKESKAMNIVNDVKIVLNSISKNDNYQSGFDENRFIIWDMSFSVFADIIPPYEKSSVIQKVVIDTAEMITSDYVHGKEPVFLKGKYGVETTEKV